MLLASVLRKMTLRLRRMRQLLLDESLNISEVGCVHMKVHWHLGTLDELMSVPKMNYIPATKEIVNEITGRYQ